MVRVSDESMVNVGIRDRDLAIIEKIDTARNGDIILTSIYNILTIKRYFIEKDHIRLQPENDNMDSILIDKCNVLGKLVGIFRSFI